MPDHLPAKTAPSQALADPTDLQRQRDFLAAATADNTRRAYRSAIRHFLGWGGLLPCDEALVLRYLLAFAARLNPRTLSLRLTALSQWHRQQNFPDPAATHTVRKTLLGIARVHGKPKDKARALAVADMEKISDALARRGGLRARRDNALLQLAYFGAYRRSEVVALQVHDVVWLPEGIQLTLPRSKTDQEGQGIAKAIPFGSGACCPAGALRAWLDDAGIAAGPLFRAIDKLGRPGEAGLHEANVNSILRDAATAAGLSFAQQLSSHSLRRGMATAAWRAGADLRDIKRQGGWRHDATVQGYIDDASLFDDNAAGKLLRPRQT